MFLLTTLKTDNTPASPAFPRLAWLAASLVGGVLGNSAMSPFAPPVLLYLPAVSGMAIVLLQWLVVRGRVAQPRIALANVLSASIAGWVLGAIAAILGTTLLNTLNLLAVGQSEPAALLRGATFAAFAGAVMGLAIGQTQAVVLDLSHRQRVAWLLTSSVAWAMGIGLYGAAIAGWVADGPGWRSVMAQLGIGTFGAYRIHWVGFLGLLGALSGVVIGGSTGIALTWLSAARPGQQPPSAA